MRIESERILITGGLGFIGKNLTEFLSRMDNAHNLKIINIDKKGYGYANFVNFNPKRAFDKYVEVNMDLSHEKNLEKLKKILIHHEIDAIINLAAETHVDRSIANPLETIKNNVFSILTLLEAIRNSKRDIKFIHISTDEVYGDNYVGKTSENTLLDPSSPYSSSKAATDEIIKSYYKTYNIHSTILRSSNNFGPYQYPEKLIPKTIILSMLNKPIPVYGSGDNIREYMYVEDFARAIVFSINNYEFDLRIHNVSSSNPIKVLSLVKKILKLMNKSEESIVYVEDRPGHDKKYMLDNSKITKELKWKPLWDMETALIDTIKWYASNKKWWTDIINRNKKLLSKEPWKERW